MTAYRLTGNDVGTSPCHDGRPRSQRLVRSLSRTARRAALRLGLLWLGLLGLLSACTSEDAILLQIRPPSGVTISEYAVTVQDHDKREILYQ